MIKHLFSALRFTAIAAVILVLGQIPVGHQRICDHVRDVVQHTHVQKPIQWVAARFNPTAGFHGAADAANAKNETGRVRYTHAAGSEHSESDRARLSGLLKH